MSEAFGPNQKGPQGRLQFKLLKALLPRHLKLLLACL